MHPKVLHGMIVQNNAAVFNNFIEFPKPILIAANGPAIGAWSVEFHNHINWYPSEEGYFKVVH